MIVEPGFVDHWKLTELASRLNDLGAAYSVILRLWGYCQERRQWRFEHLPVFAVARICKYGGNAEELVLILLELRVLTKYKSGFAVHDWEKSNGSLISAWKNGAKGGRPPSQKTDRFSKPEGYSAAITAPSNLVLSNPISSSQSTKGEVQGGDKRRPQTREEVLDFVRSIGLPETDGHYFFDHWQGNGFKNSGKPILDWKATIRSWQQANHLPSQKQFQPSHFRPLSFTDRKKRKGEIQEQLNAQYRSTNKNAAGKPEFSAQEQAERDRLYAEMESL